MENYDYFMLKPESQRYFLEIINYIKSQEIEIQQFYKVEDWQSLSKQLYSEEFEKNEGFETGFNSLAYITDCLFGNNAIIITIKPRENENYKQFTEKVLKIKKEIRKIYKKSDSFFFIGNTINMPINNSEKKINGTIKLEDCNRKYTRSTKRKRKGNVSISFI